MRQFKNYSLPLLLLFSLQGVKAQFGSFRTKERADNLVELDKSKITYGFYLNANNFDFKINPDVKYGMNAYNNSVVSKSSSSFGTGFIVRFLLNDYLDVRTEPGLQFVERKLYFDTQQNNKYIKETNRITLSDQDKVRDLKATYIDIPLLFEYHGDRWYNSRPYIAAGIHWMYNLQSNENSDSDNSQGVFRTKSSNYAASAEIGLQLYFNKFKLTPAVRGMFMLNNELVGDNASTSPYWASSISSMRTRAVMFVLKFE